MRLLLLPVAAAALAFPLAATGKPPEPPRPQTSLPVGKWTVAFAIGVTQRREIRKGGTASVVEPPRTTGGKATVQGSSTVIVYEDDRVERWTLVSPRLVVGHWYPACPLSTAAPVLGIAERAR